MATCNHVNSSGHHRCRMDQRGDRRGAFHRIRQPDIQRNLRGLAGSTKNKQKSDRNKDTAMPLRVDTDGVEDVSKVERAKLTNDEEHRKQEAEVADAVDDERFFSCVGG